LSKTIKKELAQRGLVTVLGVPELVNRKGDSSLRETLYIREKDYSQFDEFKEELISTIYHLLINTGVYEVSVSFGESIIETKSFFGSYCYEVHEAEDILDNNFLLEQYPIISYKEKEIAMSENIDFTINSSYSQNNVNENWQKIMQKMANFSFVSKELIHNAVKNIIKMREDDVLYLKRFKINIANNSVILILNCGGILKISLKEEVFKEFLETNFWQQTKKAVLEHQYCFFLFNNYSNIFLTFPYK